METDELTRAMPFAEAMGIRLVAATSEEVVGELEWAADRTTAGGALHGGAVMALADSVGAVCAFLNLPDGAAGTTTIQSSTNFLGSVREGTLVATARPLHVGRTTIVVTVDLDAGRPVARTTQTQAVLT